MATFITLTGHNGKQLRIRSASIDAFERLNDKTAVYIGGETYHVTETPEQIDKMLGVTADPVRDAAPALLNELRDLVGWIEENQRSIEAEVLTDDLLDGPRAALRAARGE